MKLPAWLLKYIEEPTFRWMSIAILAGSIAFQILSYAVNGWYGHPQAIYFFWGFYIVVILPVCYWQRNTK